jgi:hypothetical protein
MLHWRGPSIAGGSRTNRKEPDYERVADHKPGTPKFKIIIVFQ